MSRLKGHVGVVTGAARGLGRAIAVAFAREGADLLLIDIGRDLEHCPYPLGSREQLEKTAEKCLAFGSEVEVAIADVRSQEEVSEAITKALARFGQIDSLVNNAGIAGPAGRIAHELSYDEWSLVIDVNLNGAWRCSRAVLPSMMKRRTGCIINIASVAGLIAFRHYSNYVTAKHGLVGLTRALALDYAPWRIRVNALCPGMIRDDPALDGQMLAAVAEIQGISLEDSEDIFKQNHAMHALIEARDVAMSCVWLASDEGYRVTGAIIPIDAGMTAK